jgi:lipopolysaccharide transport system permease protein
MKSLLLSAWRYRYFILSSIKVDFRSRFVRSRLGGLWMIINPLVQAAMFALILSQVFAGRLPDMADNKLAYPIYLLSGTLAWNIFTEVITRCMNVFIENGNLLKKMVFPRICLPMIVTGAAIVNNLLLLGAILFIIIILGFVPGYSVVWLPLLMVVTLLLSLGIGLILGTLNVFIRDIGQMVPIVLQLGWWFTPIMYPASVVPESILPLMKLNPMYWLVQGFQNAILFDRMPPLLAIGCIAVISALLLQVALMLFRKASGEMVDVL